MSDKSAAASWASMGVLGMMGAGAGLLYYLAGGAKKRDLETFKRLILDAEVTNPKEVWKICCEHHKSLRSEVTKTKAELIEAQARIAAGEEICRVGQGLADLRKMMKGEDLPPEIKLKQMFGAAISEEEMTKAIEKMRQGDVPLEVKTAIIAHWWTELWGLFVPWGILTPGEIAEVEAPFFRLVDTEEREAVLRGEVFAYKKSYESYKGSYDDMSEKRTALSKKHYTEKREWEQEREELLLKIAQYESDKVLPEAQDEDG